MPDSIFLARPTQTQYQWQQMELGLFIHWFPMGWYQDIDQSRVTDPAYRRELLARCTCDTLDTDQWVRSAQDLGAKYLMFVAKHALGFCAWQTREGDFGMKDIPWKNGQGDVVADLAASCRKAGVKLGIYLAADSMHLNVGNAGRAKDPAFQAEYNRIYRTWLTELLSCYGEVAEVWFDGSLEIDVGDILKAYAPRAMVFQSKYATIRWVGQELGLASDPAWHTVSRYDAISGVSTQRHGSPQGDAWLPLECDARIRRDWGYHHNLEENPLKSLDDLMDMYYGSVGRGAVLLLNQAPHPQGHILPQDMERMREFGDEIRRRFSHPVAEGGGAGSMIEVPVKDSCCQCAKASQCRDRSSNRLLIDHVELREDIRQGQRVRAYRVEGLADEQWHTLSTGTAIGYKKLDWFAPRPVECLRVHVLESAGLPILSLKAYSAGITPSPKLARTEKQILAGEWGTEHYDLNTCTADLQFNLSPFLKEAGQYLATFCLETEGLTPLALEKVWLEIAGVPQESYIKAGETPGSYHLYIPGITGQVALHAVSRYEFIPNIRGKVLLEMLAD